VRRLRSTGLPNPGRERPALPEPQLMAQPGQYPHRSAPQPKLCRPPRPRHRPSFIPSWPGIRIP
jgi:hypothetical protein